MKKVLFLLLLLPQLALAQRYDNFTITADSNNVITAIPFASISVCSHPANAVPCTNYATTYTDATLTVACDTAHQIVLQGTSSCTNTSDAQGNFGIFAFSGQYDYTITLATASYGPFTVSVAPATNIINNFTSNQIFSGSLFSFAAIMGVDNKVVKPDACLYPNKPSWCGSASTEDAMIAAASTQLGGSGVIDARGFGATSQTIASKVDIGSSTFSQALLVDTQTSSNCTIVTQNYCWLIHRGSSIVGEGNNTANPIAGLKLDNNAQVLGLIGTTTDGNSGSAFRIANIFAICGGSATVYDACVSWYRAIQGSSIENVSISGAKNSPALKIYGGFGQLAVDTLVINPNIACQQRVGCLPVLMGCFQPGTNSVSTYLKTSCAGVSAHFVGGIYVHQGTGIGIGEGAQAVHVEGCDNTTPNCVRNAVTADFLSPHLESENAPIGTDYGFQCNACYSLDIQNPLTSAATNGGGSVLYLTATGTTRPLYASLVNTIAVNSWTNWVENTINGKTYAYTNNLRFSYHYSDLTSGLEEVWDNRNGTSASIGPADFTAGALDSTASVVTITGTASFAANLSPDVAGTRTVGTTLKPFLNLIVGNAASQSASLKCTACTGNRNIEFQDANGTVAFTSQVGTKTIVSLTPGAATVSSCVEQPFTVSGTSIGQWVTVSPPTTLGTHVWISYVRASGANTVQISFCADATGGTPPSGNWVFSYQ